MRCLIIHTIIAQLGISSVFITFHFKLSHILHSTQLIPWNKPLFYVSSSLHRFEIVDIMINSCESKDLHSFFLTLLHIGILEKAPFFWFYGRGVSERERNGDVKEKERASLWVSIEMTLKKK